MVRPTTVGRAIAIGSLVIGTGNVVVVAALGLPINVVFSPDLIAGVAAPAMGLVIVGREPRNRLGWVFLVIGTASAIWGAATLLLMSGMESTGPVGVVVAWLATWAYYPAYALAFGVVPLLFPDGRLPGPRWTAAGWGIGAVIAAQGVLEAFGQPAAAAAPVANPWFSPTLGEAADALGPVLDRAWWIAVVVSTAGMLTRFRGATGARRAQLLWFSGAVLVGAGALLFFQRGVVLVVLLPVASAIAIARHRLYDIEVVATRAIVYGGLAAVAAGIYVAIVVGLGSVAGRSTSDLRLIFIATVATVVVFQPLHRSLLIAARRLVYGPRSSPYEAMSDLTTKVGAAMSASEVLPAMSDAIAAALPAEAVEVRAWLPDGRAASATWPSEQPTPGREEGHRFPIHHGGQEIGEFLVHLSGDAAPSPAEQRLLHDLATHAGPALRTVVLASELATRLQELTEQSEQLRTSRARLVAAEDDARRAIERDIHDGAQQQLLALAVDLGRAERLIERDTAEAAALVNHLQERAAATLTDLRSLASGTYPPALSELGVGAALRARMAEIGADVVVTDELRRRLPQQTETALYFSILEAVQNATKHSGARSITVSLRDEADHVTFIVRDDGSGFRAGAAPGRGLQNITDRIAVVGGTVDIAEGPGAGTTVTGRVPMTTTATDDHRADSDTAGAVSPF